ncbi:DUF4148 domain-containing protein [Caballeronia sp. AZ7_KS35]|uniref:DUF4148 domain-containing protein n=1 Tax=Caballeronia sp. AZ7_KS35 TaxID=2921762 RepID=UPI0020278A30|nr:DUF4148 domain-containing protein [Caballeronia sp. AZ7_KS35]
MNTPTTAMLSAMLMVPLMASAQSNETLTRDQVRTELVQLERAGYDPLSQCSGDCPGSLRRAQAVIMRERAAGSTAYGPGTNGTAQSGR